MTKNELSPLAEKLYTKLNSESHLYSIESAAKQLMEDYDLSTAKREAYREIYEHAKSDY